MKNAHLICHQQRNCSPSNKLTHEIAVLCLTHCLCRNWRRAEDDTKILIIMGWGPYIKGSEAFGIANSSDLIDFLLFCFKYQAPCIDLWNLVISLRILTGTNHLPTQWTFKSLIFIFFQNFFLSFHIRKNFHLVFSRWQWLWLMLLLCTSKTESRHCRKAILKRSKLTLQGKFRCRIQSVASH